MPQQSPLFLRTGYPPDDTMTIIKDSVQTGHLAMQCVALFVIPPQLKHRTHYFLKSSGHALWSPKPTGDCTTTEFVAPWPKTDSLRKSADPFTAVRPQVTCSFCSQHHRCKSSPMPAQLPSRVPSGVPGATKTSLVAQAGTPFT